MSTSLFVLAILFVTVVVPTWIVCHYLTRWKQMRGLSREDETLLAEVWEAANKLEARIESLEKVLDHDRSDWRRRP